MSARFGRCNETINCYRQKEALAKAKIPTIIHGDITTLFQRTPRLGNSILLWRSPQGHNFFEGFFTAQLQFKDKVTT